MCPVPANLMFMMFVLLPLVYYLFVQVGEDLSEGEAKVLQEYGWIPNTGLGTLLNYRDRVVHDRWNERYSTDWRMKIGKLLMNGYSEGELIITHVPLNTSSEEIKLEIP